MAVSGEALTFLQQASTIARAVSIVAKAGGRGPRDVATEMKYAGGGLTLPPLYYQPVILPSTRLVCRSAAHLNKPR